MLGVLTSKMGLDGREGRKRSLSIASSTAGEEWQGRFIQRLHRKKITSSRNHCYVPVGQDNKGMRICGVSSDGKGKESAKGMHKCKTLVGSCVTIIIGRDM